MVKYDINWLKEKGFFEKIISLKIEDKEVIVDGNNLLAYVEVSNNEEVEKIIKELSSSAQKIKYIWFYFQSEEKVKVFRRYGGELRWFWYKPGLRKEFLKSREDKLNKFSVKNMDILFDTRDIAERFYWQLWEARIKLAKSIQDLKEDGNKLLVVQHLLDRLIFFYFLAQLGFVRIKNKEIDWKLDRKRTREFFEWICKTLSEKDLQDFLNKIFFDVLGEVKENGWSSEYFKIRDENFLVTAPSLNGGLFVEDEFEGKHEREIRIKGIKELILEILNEYNWVIGEDVPEEEDVIGDLTPEIIGHIYEKFVVSLEQIGIEKIKLRDVQTVRKELRYGRKKIGAYYTPEEITNYISMNTIYPYIRDRLKNKFGNVGESLFNDLFKKENFTKEELAIIKYLYFEVLAKIKICDNACGSGSFLIAAGDVLLRLYSRILKILEDNLSEDKDVEKVLTDIRKSLGRDYYIVRQIIVNNLYGVDIMEGAIEIAKLRFWLWLISKVDPKKVEDKRIETLPNLDFNLMVGNSLIGFVDIGEVEFNFITEQKTLSSWFGESKVEWLRNLAKKKQEFKTLPSHKAIKLKEKLNRELEQARKFLDEKFLQLLKSKGIEISKEEFLKLKPFHWGFEFYEVFDLEKPKEERGFDIVIGNPPYINIYNIPEKEKEIYSTLYKFAYKKYDIYIIFIERSINLFNRFGKFSYITSDKWIAEEYGYKFREFIIKNQNVGEIVDLRSSQVFKGVGIRNVIFFLDKNKKFNKILISNSEFKIKNYLPYTAIKQHPRYSLRLDLSPIDLLIIPTITHNSYNLGDICYVTWGCRPSPSEKYVFNSFEECLKRTKDKDLCKRIIKGANIGRYYFNWGGKWLAYLKSMYNPLSPDVFENDRIIIKDIGVRPIKATFISKNEKIYSDNTTINILNWRVILPSENNIKFKKDVNLKTLLVVINSKLINYFIISFLSDQLHVLPENTKKLPIKFPNDQQSFITLCNYMLFLNKTEERRESEKDIIDFIDKQIIDSLVYELYFKEKFEQDGIKTNLLQLVEPYLKDIENLKSDEEKLKTIKQVTEKIRNDSKVMKEIEKIKSHKWVKIIEGGKNDSQS